MMCRYRMRGVKLRLTLFLQPNHGFGESFCGSGNRHPHESSHPYMLRWNRPDCSPNPSINASVPSIDSSRLLTSLSQAKLASVGSRLSASSFPTHFPTANRPPLRLTCYGPLKLRLTLFLQPNHGFGESFRGSERGHPHHFLIKRCAGTDPKTPQIPRSGPRCHRLPPSGP